MSSGAASPDERWRTAGDAVVGNLRDSGTTRGSLSDVASDAAAAAGLSFVASVNRRKSFSATFGQRSLSSKLEVVAPETVSRNSRRSLTKISVVDSKDDASNINPDTNDVKVVQVSANNFRVTSTCSHNYLLEPVVPFKVDQFVRTFLYEVCPPFVNWYVVMFVEILVFRHTVEEALCCSSARGFTPLPGPLAQLVSRFDPPDSTGNVDVVIWGMFWIPVFAVAFSSEVRRFIEPLELLPFSILLLCRVSVISCKYALLPSSYCGDQSGKIYGVITQADMNRTLVGGAWLDPKLDAHRDLLRQDVENACLEADVDLSDTKIDVGSVEAATVVRARAGGVGKRSEEKVETSSTVVSGKELIAAIIDTHIGQAIPTWMLLSMMVGGIAFGLVGPVCRGVVGVRMFGRTSLSQGTAALMFLSSTFLFLNNMVFTLSCYWNFHRQKNAIRCLNNVMRFPGEPITNLLPPMPKTKSKNGPNPNANNGGNENRKKSSDVPQEHPSMVAARVAASRGAVILVDLKDPQSCLCWSLVRRALRRVGSSWARRMNLYSVVFLVAAFVCAGSLLLLFYGADTVTHRLATAGALFYLAVVISALCSLTVMEGSAINDLVPTVRTYLKREVVAIAAQLAGMRGNKSNDKEEHVRRTEREALTDAMRLIERVEQYVHLEEEHAHPVEVFYSVPATTAAITFTVTSLLSMLLIAAQQWFEMTRSEGWSYGGASGEFRITNAVTNANATS